MNSKQKAQMRLSAFAGAVVMAALVNLGGVDGAQADNLGGALGVASSTRVTVKGTVNGKPESVAFSGPVVIDARTVDDPEIGSPSNVELTLDLRGLKGKGLKSHAKYRTKTREVINLPLGQDGVGTVAVDFPFQLTTDKGVTASKVGHASFDVTFTVPDGLITSARGKISTPAVVAASQQ